MGPAFLLGGTFNPGKKDKSIIQPRDKWNLKQGLQFQQFWLGNKLLIHFISVYVYKCWLESIKSKADTRGVDKAPWFEAPGRCVILRVGGEGVLTQHTLHSTLFLSASMYTSKTSSRGFIRGVKHVWIWTLTPSCVIYRGVSCAGSDRRRYAAALFTKTMFLQCKWASSHELFSVLIVRFVTTLPLSIDLNVTYKILLMQLCAVLKNEQSAWLGAILVTRGLIFISSLKNWSCVWNLAPSCSGSLTCLLLCSC